jgi:hypothetical protein
VLKPGVGKLEADGAKADVPVCTAKQFRIDIQGTPGSEWNKSAGWVFVDDFLAKSRYRSSIEMRFTVHEAFTARVKSLTKVFREKIKSEAEQKEIKKKHHRYERKSSASESILPLNSKAEIFLALSPQTRYHLQVQRVRRRSQNDRTSWGGWNVFR